MSIFQAIILGALQGITEFLPISSSGHLAIAQHLFGLELPLIFDVSLHLASLLAVLLVFRKILWSLIISFGRWVMRKNSIEDELQLNTILSLILASIVTAAFGLVFKKLIPDLPLIFIFGGFILTACALAASHKVHSREVEKNTKEPKKISVLKALVIGASQGIGVLPGISRSGITISSSLFLKLDRKTAGEFSFLLSIPAILGAFILEAKDLTSLTTEVSLISLLIGCFTSFIVGYFSLRFLLKLIQKGKLYYFAFYLMPVAVLGFIFIH